MVSQDEILTRFRQLFVFKDDSIIRHIGATWIWQETKVTDRLILDHLTRRACIGLCPVRKGEVKWAAMDFDAHGDHCNAGRQTGLRTAGLDHGKNELQADVLATVANLDKYGIDGHIEDSGRGYHLWVFFNRPLPADPVRERLRKAMVGDHEIYCNGHSIRLPLGAYPGDKRMFCCFLDREFRPFPDQRDYLIHGIRPTEASVFVV